MPLRAWQIDPGFRPQAGRARAILRQPALVELVAGYDPHVDEGLLNQAYVQAMRLHGSQKRDSGDPYFHHPVEVAGILAGWRLDSRCVAAGLLHDVLEDTAIDHGELARQFGAEVAGLVEGVTKLGRLPAASRTARDAENFRKLLLAMSGDLRVLLIKLADRLDNMRTLGFLSQERRRRIATETLEIFAPLADRIGMSLVRDELEDLAFAELEPAARAGILARIDEACADAEGLLAAAVEVLLDVLAQAGVAARVVGRHKSPYSIWRKMARKGHAFDALCDLIAVRVIVADEAQCYRALGLIHAALPLVPGRFKDYLSVPKPNGYRSLHTVVMAPGGVRFEVQIRTHAMDAVAERGLAAHWAYREGAPQSADGEPWPWVRGLLELLDQVSDPEEFLEHTRLELFREQVFCFTPKGAVLALPKGATALDFAYAVHGQIGDMAAGARIDGRQVALATPLENGQQVEIQTRRHAHPTPDWERWVVTGRARAHVRRWLRSRQRVQLVALGRERLAIWAGAQSPALSVEAVLAGLPDRLLREAGGTAEEALIKLGSGVWSPSRLLPRRAVRQRGAKAPARPAPAGPVAGLPAGLAVTWPACCRPVPGEPIVGVPRTGRGLAIHGAGCPVAVGPGLLPLAWAEGARAAARLLLLLADRPGVLAAIGAVLARHGCNITGLKQARASGGLSRLRLEVEVAGRDQLAAVLAELAALPVVRTVRREGEGVPLAGVAA